MKILVVSFVVLNWTSLRYFIDRKLRRNVFHDEFDTSSIPAWWDAMQNKKKKSMKIWFTSANNMQSCLEIWKQNPHPS